MEIVRTLSLATTAPSQARRSLRAFDGTVVDSGCGFPDPDAAEAPPGQHGWGLPIVHALADRWGTDRGPDTKVWAEFALRG